MCINKMKYYEEIQKYFEILSNAQNCSVYMQYKRKKRRKYI